MINVRGLQRNVKNVVKNYTEAQVKVREATSNDPWGPPSTLMAEIADLTYNVVAFSEIMQMIWKRLNDHGKNWRHVYKALSLLDYLIKTGSEKVAQQCRENIFSIQTLKDFQHLEENKDQGLNVREKSKALVALLKDEEKLKTERARALKAKERFAQSISHMSYSASMETLPKTSASYHEGLNSSSSADRTCSNVRSSSSVNNELEQARPQTIGEEELQLQLALAMSKEEAEADERQRKNDDLRLKLAITESEKEKQKKKASALDDLLSIDLGNNLTTTTTNLQLDPWGPIDTFPTMKNNLDAFGSVVNNSASNDPWSGVMPTTSTSNNMLTAFSDSTVDNDPWSPKNTLANDNSKNNSISTSPWQPSSQSTIPLSNDPWASPQTLAKSPDKTNSPINILAKTEVSNLATRKTPENFLGLNSNLVNLDALVGGKTNSSSSSLIGNNPFASVSVPNNPFQAAKPPPPTINQLRSQNNFLNENSINSSFSSSSSLPSQPIQQAPLNPLVFSQPINLNPTVSTPNNPFAM